MKIIYSILALTLYTFLPFTQAENVYAGPASYTTSSSDFLEAKYLIELVYITSDKELVREFASCYSRNMCYKPKYRELRWWAYGKNKTIVLKVLKRFTEIEFNQ
jgi:hypothetical protein